MIFKANELVDQGLPPPMPKRIDLTEKEVADIQSCAAESEQIRPFANVYIGNFRNGLNSEFHSIHGGARKGFDTDHVHDNNRTFILRHFLPEFGRSKLGGMTYEDIMKKTSFALAPRGDNKFSYRFSEVLSAGTIPVVLSDDWIWPFRAELVDWNACAIILPERMNGRPTIDLLDNMTAEEKCERRRNCYRIYKQYIVKPEGTIDFGKTVAID